MNQSTVYCTYKASLLFEIFSENFFLRPTYNYTDKLFYFVNMKTENNTERLEIRISATLKRDMNKHIRKNKVAVGSAEFIRGLIVKEIYPAQ